MERKMVNLAVPGLRDKGSKRALQLVSAFLREERGATAIEYGMLCGLIAVALIGTMSVFGQAVARPYNVVADAIDVF